MIHKIMKAINYSQEVQVFGPKQLAVERGKLDQDIN